MEMTGLAASRAFPSFRPLADRLERIHDMKSVKKIIADHAERVKNSGKGDLYGAAWGGW